MRTLALSIALILIIFQFKSAGQDSPGIYSKTIPEFKKDFENALDQGFSKSDFNKMYKDYSVQFWPLFSRAEGNPFKTTVFKSYPLESFKSDSLYKEGINTLFNSDNLYQRSLAYSTIGATGDKSFETELLARLEEDEPEEVSSIGLALLFLVSDHTTPLFEFLMKHEDFGDAHFAWMLQFANADSLRNTARNKITNDDRRSRTFAASLLSKVGQDSLSDRLLRLAVKEWPLDQKGFAISALKELRAGNLLELFKIPLADKKTRKISLKAMANSPSAKDQAFIRELMKRDHKVSDEILDALVNSDNSEFVMSWLVLIQSDRVSRDYSTWLEYDLLLFADSLVPHVLSAIPNVKNEQLARTLKQELKSLERRKAMIGKRIRRILAPHR